MVLQQAPAKAQVWGFAPPGTKVSVTTSAAGKAVKATTAADGTWQVALAPAVGSMKPVTVTATADAADADAAITLVDVLYGDVWFCSGQSNMYVRDDARFFQLRRVLHLMSPWKSWARQSPC